MASAFSHAAFAVAVSSGFSGFQRNWKLVGLSALCAAWPDVDALGYFMGVPYASQWGHRGFTHSIFFACIWGFFLAWLFFRENNFRKTFTIFILLFLCTASHPLLDAMTDAGKGVALFWPWDTSRYFFDFRPITASPISITRFFTDKGLQVLKNELVWIWLPSFFIFLILRLTKRFYRQKRL